LDQNVEHAAILINGPPEVMPGPVDRQKHFIQVPRVTGSGAPPAELIGISLVEFPTPFADGFVRDDHPTDEEQFFYIAIAEAKPEIQPDTAVSCDTLGDLL